MEDRSARPARHVEQTECWLVSGLVQGVGFRYHVWRAAVQHGVCGDVCNLPDGRVQVRARGALEGLRALRLAVTSGPPGARVDRVEREAVDGEIAGDGFRIRG